MTRHPVIVTYSIESVLLGMNAVLYGFCAYTLWGQKSLSCRMLFILNTVLFLLCAAQITLHAIFLFIVFTVITGSVQAYLDHVNGYILAASIIYNINFATGGLLSMWRLYVLYDSNFRVCIPAFIVWIGQMSASAFTIYYCATVPLIMARFNPMNMLLWAFITTLHLYATIPICIRLCMAQKRTHTTLSRSPYKSIAIIMVECGALTTLCSVAMLVLYARNVVYALASLGIATEVAVASQLLITARHAMLSHNRNASNPLPTAIRTNVMTVESRHTNISDAPGNIRSLFIRARAKLAGQGKLTAVW